MLLFVAVACIHQSPHRALDVFCQSQPSDDPVVEQQRIERLHRKIRNQDVQHQLKQAGYLLTPDQKETREALIQIGYVTEDKTDLHQYLSQISYSNQCPSLEENAD